MHWEQDQKRKAPPSSSFLVFSGQADLSSFFPTIPVILSSIRYLLPAPMQF